MFSWIFSNLKIFEIEVIPDFKKLLEAPETYDDESENDE